MVDFNSCILFLGQLKNKEVLDIMGRDYCLLTLQITLNQEAYCSENVICSRRTDLIPEQFVERDMYGEPLDKVQQRFNKDPSSFINLSHQTIMPIFNESNFIFYINQQDFLENKTVLKVDLYLN